MIFKRHSHITTRKFTHKSAGVFGSGENNNGQLLTLPHPIKISGR